MPSKRQPRKKWLFNPTSQDEQVVEEERERLATLNPGVKITRADAIRSLFARVKALEVRKVDLEAYKAALEAEIAKRDFEYRGRREEDLQGAA